MPGLFTESSGSTHSIHSSRPWWRRWFPLITGLAFLALAPIIARGQTADTVVVSWTAPGDDGAIGTATTYDLRWSLSPITASSFSSATAVAGVASPAASGTRQSATVLGLTRGTTYYFALRTNDDAGNWSTISNVARWDWTLDATAPAAPQGLALERSGSNVRVSWSANTEPDLLGYKVYRSANSGGPYAVLNTSTITGTEFIDSSIPEGATVLWYQVSASDVTGNESARSAAFSIRLADGAQAEWRVEDGYPNPSRASSPVQIPVVNSTTASSRAVLDVLDAGGRVVRRMEFDMAPGRQEVQWDGKNDAGRVVAPGAYRVVLNAGGKRTTSRLLRVP